LTDTALVPDTVAAAVGARGGPGQPIQATLLSFLRAKGLLLILDNCEHLIDDCARLADTILRGCPDVRILARSREALGLAGEVSRRVPSLDVPDPNHLPSLDQVGQIEAVRLFADRARAVAPGFAVTHQNAPSVARVCRRLDGIPLALELAAARL